MHLLSKLLGQARQTLDDPAGRYVLFLEVRNLEAEARNPQGISRVVEEMATLYEVDAAALKAEGLALLIKGLRTDVETADAVRQLILLAGDELEADRIDSAQKAVDQASALAKKLKNLPLASKAETKGREIAERRKRLESVLKARETLAKAPNDPAANLEVGRYECLGKGQWKTGLPLLAKGADAGLRAAAERDLSAPEDADAQAVVGNGWWALADAEKDAAARRRLRSRAAVWYQKAIAGAEGQQRALLAKRLGEARDDLVQGTWTDHTDPGIFLLNGKPGEPIAPGLEGQPGRMVVLAKWPLGDYDGVSVRVRRGPPKNGAGAMLLFDPDYGVIVEPETGVAAVLQRNQENPEWKRATVEKVEKKDIYDLTVVIDGGEWLVYVDGLQLLRIPTSRTQISDVGLQIQLAVFSFDQFRLRKKP